MKTTSKRRRISVNSPDYNKGTLLPEAHIAVNKNRKKVYRTTNPNEPNFQESLVYLDDGTEFQVELYNPTSKKLMFVLSFNGIESKNGLILRPGERHFLDRFVDNNSKLLFDTYNVNNTPTNRKAIKLNGVVEIKVYEEQNFTWYSGSSLSINTTPNLWYGSWTNPNPYNTITSNNTVTINPTNNTYYSSTATNINNSICSQSKTYSDNVAYSDAKIETGRVEEGTKSEQEFKQSSFNPSSLPTRTIKFLLKPTSTKPVTVKDLNNEKKYCPNCGKKCIRKGFKFCPECGGKI